ncbi:hypothetical protein [Phenylobacterium sp.]|jgi:hypothetical protein|uniref:hypothetical protein n=1 Tax=Phenylobacterium sp. TaxID=1871053 RepID=UPI0037CC0F11
MRVRLLLPLIVVFAASSATAADLASKMIMALDVNPAAVAFWAAGNDPPEGESVFAADARWTAAVQGAQALQAKGKLLQSPGIAREGAWSTFAEMMTQVGAEGEIAARAKEAEKAFEIGGRLYDACNGCHKAYVPRTPGA